MSDPTQETLDDGHEISSTTRRHGVDVFVRRSVGACRSELTGRLQLNSLPLAVFCTLGSNVLVKEASMGKPPNENSFTEPTGLMYPENHFRKPSAPSSGTQNFQPK